MAKVKEKPKRVWYQPGTNVKVFEPNRALAEDVAALTREAIYEVVNRVLAKYLPAERQRAFNAMARELGGESGGA